MRGAGYDVRVLPEEGLGWEENPPTLLEFIRRDLRWCQGNMQYWRFLSLPGLRPVSRYQLALAIVMFIGSPAWIGMLVLGTLSLAAARRAREFHPNGRGHSAVHLRVGDVVLAEDCKRHRHSASTGVLSRVRRRRPLRLSTWSSKPCSRSCCVRFSGSAIRSSCLACFSVARSAGSVRYATITRFLSPLRCGVCGRTRCSAAPPSACLAATHPGAIPYVLFLAGGPALAIPFAMITAWPLLGRFVRPDRHWSAARGDHRSGRAACPGAARDRDGGAVATAKFGLTRCSKH